MLDEVEAAARAGLRSRPAGDAGDRLPASSCEVAAGRLDAAAALALMQRDTVRYAKRQMTWFAREPDIDVARRRGGGRRRGVAATIAGKLDKMEGRIG